MAVPGDEARGRGVAAPYVDTSLYPPFDLLSTAQATGVKDFTLAFVLSGGGCIPKWGGVSDLNTDGVPGQIGQLRQLGGDARVSFGRANGTELAQARPDASSLAAGLRRGDQRQRPVASGLRRRGRRARRRRGEHPTPAWS